MICWFLDVQPQGLSHFCHPIDNEVSNFLVRARDFGGVLGLARPLLALRIHRPQDIRGVQLVQLRVPLQSSDCCRTTLGKVCTTWIAIYEMCISTENIRRAAILLVGLAMLALVNAGLHNLYVGVDFICLSQAAVWLRDQQSLSLYCWCNRLALSGIRPRRVVGCCLWLRLQLSLLLAEFSSTPLVLQICFHVSIFLVAVAPMLPSIWGRSVGILRQLLHFCSK